MRAMVKNQCKKCKLKNLFSILQTISVSQIIVKVQSSIQVQSNPNLVNI